MAGVSTLKLTTIVHDFTLFTFAFSPGWASTSCYLLTLTENLRVDKPFPSILPDISHTSVLLMLLSAFFPRSKHPKYQQKAASVLPKAFPCCNAVPVSNIVQITKPFVTFACQSIHPSHRLHISSTKCPMGLLATWHSAPHH